MKVSPTGHMPTASKVRVKIEGEEKNGHEVKDYPSLAHVVTHSDNLST